MIGEAVDTAITLGWAYTAAAILATTGCLTIAIALPARLNHRITRRTFYACCATANALNLTACLLVRATESAAFLAGALALSLWMWWHDGGGDDTKRRLRSWAGKFRGVRRTAPVGGAV